MQFSDYIGSFGVTIVLVAYFLSILKILNPNQPAYYFLNAVGAGLACYASFLIEYTPFIILEGAWSIISSIAFIKSFVQKT